MSHTPTVCVKTSTSTSCSWRAGWAAGALGGHGSTCCAPLTVLTMWPRLVAAGAWSRLDDAGARLWSTVTASAHVICKTTFLCVQMRRRGSDVGS